MPQIETGVIDSPYPETRHAQSQIALLTGIQNSYNQITIGVLLNAEKFFFYFNI